MSAAPAPVAGTSPWRRYLGTGLVPRVLVAAVGVPCFLAITWRGGVHYLLLIGLIVFLGLREFYAMMVAKGYRPYRAIGILCGMAVCWHVYRGGATISLLLTLTLLSIMVLELFRKDISHPTNHIAITVLGVLYVGWLGSHLILLRELPRLTGASDGLGVRAVLLVVAATWAADTGAYLVGVAWGRRRLLPRVSPGKTVEGALGGVLAAAIAGGACALTFAPFLTLLAGSLLGGALGLCGLLGDLVESLLKRDVGIKDSGGALTLPGHGGILDRFDSLLFTAPFAYYYLRAIVF